MTVKHIILKSGERLITEVQEMILEGKTVGYYFIKPCLVNVMTQENGRGPNPNIKQKKEKSIFDVSLYPWVPFAKGTQVPVPLDWVVTIVDPVDMLYEMYEENVLNSTKDWNEGMNRKEEDNNENDCKTCR
jgi:hypothetical protein